MLFESLRSEDNMKTSSKLNELQQGSLFRTIEYELSGIVNKISNISTLDEREIKNIITRQHNMILNYDLFLMSQETRIQAQILFTNTKFLRCFLDVIRNLELSHHEKICINKLAYDYYITPNNDQEVSQLLYQLTTEVNGREVVVLSGIVGMRDAQILSMIRNSSFREEKVIHRVNTYIIKCHHDLSIQDIVNIYCFLYERFSNPFIYTMMESKPSGLTPEENRKFDRISIALLEILNSVPSADIKKVLYDYVFTLNMVKTIMSVRFSIKTAVRYTRILNILREIELEGYKIP